jgi:hypothetical protein
MIRSTPTTIGISPKNAEINPNSMHALPKIKPSAPKINPKAAHYSTTVAPVEVRHITEISSPDVGHGTPQRQP